MSSRFIVQGKYDQKYVRILQASAFQSRNVFFFSKYPITKREFEKN